MAERLPHVEHVDDLIVVHQLDGSRADDVRARRDGAVLDQDGGARLEGEDAREAGQAVQLFRCRAGERLIASEELGEFVHAASGAFTGANR